MTKDSEGLTTTAVVAVIATLLAAGALFMRTRDGHTIARDVGRPATA